MPEGAAKLYARLLRDIPTDVAIRAVQGIICRRTGTGPPPIGEIRREAARIMLGAPSPAEAVAEVRDQIREVGIYGVPRFSHPLVERAVRACDWRNLCMSEDPARATAELRRIYEDLLETWTARVQVDGPAVLERLGLQPAPAIASQPLPSLTARSGVA